jgi:aminoglycoside/choline kinase family phosphotransferase
MKNLKRIKGDASFRKFFRKKNKGPSSIIVYSKKEKLKNLLIYDSINKILRNNKILAPRLYKENYKKNFIEIQDFGNETIYKVFRKKKVNKFTYFKKIIQILNKIQAVKDIRVKNFKKNFYVLSKYKKKILLQEANIFCDWYVAKNLSKQYRSEFVKKYKKIVKKLVSNLKLKNNILVHRDFHISNLMLFNNQIGVIDSQDALIGNKAYDLASLIDDVRFQTSKSLKNKIYKYYIRSQKKLDKSKFQNDFYILSILRNLKIIGIFTRLAIRDGKKNYLRLIPHAWSLINMRIHEKKAFIDLKVLLSKNFKGKIK